MFTHQRFDLGLASLLLVASGCSNDDNAAGYGSSSGAGGANSASAGFAGVGVGAAGSGSMGLAGYSTFSGSSPIGGSSIALPPYMVSVQVSGLIGSGLVLQLNAANDLAPVGNGAFTFAPILDGVTPHSVTVRTQPDNPRQVCTVKNGTGQTGGVTVVVGVTCSQLARYNLLVDSIDNSVSSYVVDGKSGRSTYIGKTVTGSSPYSVTVDPSSKYAYVANSGDGTISQYSIGADGKLTALQPPTVAAGIGPRAITVHPSGEYSSTIGYRDSCTQRYPLTDTLVRAPGVEVGFRVLA